MKEKGVSKKVLLKSSFWYTLSMFLTRGMVFITMPIFTRLMTKNEYGDFSVFASWQAILIVICSIELYATLNRARFDFPGEKEFQSYITSSIALSSLLTAFIFILYIIFPHIFDRFFLLDRRYMFFMFAYLLFTPVLNMFQAKQRIEYRYKLSSAISMSVTLISPILAVIMVLLMKNDRVFGRIIGQYILYILVGAAFLVYFISLSREVRVKYWKYALRIGLPLVFSFLGSRIMLAADTIVVKHLCTSEQVSNISVTHTTSHIVLILVQTLNTAWAPWFYDMLKIENFGEIRKVFKIYLWAMIACTFGVLLIGPEVILVLGGAKYSEAVYILPLNILCGVFTVLTAQFVNFETYHKKPEYAATLTAIAAVLNVVLDIVGVKLFGYRAACYVTVLCQLVLVAMHYYVCLRMKVNRFLPVRELVIPLGATLSLIPLALLLYQNRVIRYIFVFVVILAACYVGYKKRDEIIGLIKKFRSKKSNNQPKETELKENS